ncbi:MAG: PDZ domain-containing protein [Elusimicrobia bacterium]|nr:PDZ domain-containing protein [Elusimicrobiota bacterium]
MTRPALYAAILLTGSPALAASSPAADAGFALGQLRTIAAALRPGPAPSAPAVPPASQGAPKATPAPAKGAIGVILHRVGGSDAAMVAGVVPGSPADRAGLKARDMITEVDGQPVEPWSEPELRARVRGTPGTVVTLTVERDNPYGHPGAGETLSIDIRREVVPKLSGPLPDVMHPSAVVRTVMDSNARLLDLVRALDLSAASPSLQQALRVQARVLAEARFQVQAEARGDGKQAAAEGLDAAAKASLAQAQDALGRLSPIEQAELEELKRRAPRSTVWLAGLALQAQAANLRRAMNEYGKHIGPLMARLETLGARDDHRWRQWPYEKNAEGERPREARLTREVEAVVNDETAPPAYVAAADAIAAACAYRHPPSL